MDKVGKLLKFKRTILFLLITSGWVGAPQVFADGPDFSESPRIIAMVDELASDEGFDRRELLHLLGQAEFKQSIIDAITRPAEKTLAWYEYRKIFVTDKRTARGVAFWEEHALTLARAEQTYGVSAEIIAAIIGVETYYGRQKGGYRVLDALATLAASDYRRNDFFRSQLKAFLILSRDEKQDPREAVGSYAGAIGIPQFIPTSFQHYAVDFDGDGRRDLVNNVADAIGSVGNYLAEHGWQRGEPVLHYVDYPYQSDDSLLERGYKPHSAVSELRSLGVTWPADSKVDQQRQAAVIALGQRRGHTMVATYDNFYAITRYNHSPLYAMAVFQLSESLRAGRQR